MATFNAFQIYYCVAHNNTIHGFTGGGNSSSFIGCVSANNTGGSTVGFQLGNDRGCINCIAYGNGSDGFQFTGTGTNSECINCIAVNNGGYGFGASSAIYQHAIINCGGYNNTSGLVNTTNLPLSQQTGLITLTADPFTNAAGNDFSLNGAAGGGALLRGAGIPGSSATWKLLGLSTNSYPDVGAVMRSLGVSIKGILMGGRM